MTTRPPTVERLLYNDGRPQDAAHFIALAVRNLMEVSARKEKARVLPPVDGSSAGEAFRDFFDDLRTVGLSNFYQRLELGPRETFSPPPGRPVVMADQLRNVAQLMKHAQCKLAKGGNRAWDLADAYFKQKGDPPPMKWSAL